jgi:hypothetical protein
MSQNFIFFLNTRQSLASEYSQRWLHELYNSLPYGKSQYFRHKKFRQWRDVIVKNNNAFTEFYLHVHVLASLIKLLKRFRSISSCMDTYASK